MKKLLFFFACVVVLQVRAQTQQVPTKVGYADVDYILAQLPDSKLMLEKLKETQTRLQNDFTTKSQLFQKQYEAYTENANTMSDTVRANTERQLQQMDSELQKMQQDAQTTLENTRKLFMAPVYLKVGRAINQVAVENGFSSIVTKKVGGVDFLLYADTKMDISQLVLQKLAAEEPKQEATQPQTKKPKQ